VLEVAETRRWEGVAAGQSSSRCNRLQTQKLYHSIYHSSGRRNRNRNRNLKTSKALLKS